MSRRLREREGHIGPGCSDVSGVSGCQEIPRLRLRNDKVPQQLAGARREEMRGAWAAKGALALLGMTEYVKPLAGARREQMRGA